MKSSRLSHYTRSWPFWIVAAVALLRLAFCFDTPLYTTDVLRNLGYGLEFWTYGFRVYEMTPFDFSPQVYQFLWPNRHYTYPAVTLVFFAGLARVWASIFFVKLMLTAIDFLNAWLIARMTKSRWLGVLYLCHPVGLWFVSHEGQFESFINLLTILFLYYLQRGRPVSFLFLSLAVQTKLFPIFLVPYALYKLWGKPFRSVGRYFAWGAAGFAPSVIAALTSGYLTHLLRPGYVPKNNPISWALFQPGLHAFTPFWLVLFHWIAGIIFVVTVLWFVRSEKNFFPYLAPLTFVVFVKANLIGQFWYMLIAPVFCLTVENPAHRRVLMALTLLFGMRSLWSILIGPIGYVSPDHVVALLRGVMFGL